MVRPRYRSVVSVATGQQHTGGMQALVGRLLGRFARIGDMFHDDEGEKTTNLFILGILVDGSDGGIVAWRAVAASGGRCLSRRTFLGDAAAGGNVIAAPVAVMCSLYCSMGVATVVAIVVAALWLLQPPPSLPERPH